MSEPTPDPTPDAPEAPPVDKPEPDEPFDAERAQAKIRKANSEAENLRKRLKELEPLAAKAKELEDAQKSEAEKAADRVTASDARAAKAEGELMRLRVANAKGLTLAQANRLVGTTEEELEKDADEFLKDIGATTAPPSRRPTERLRGGSDPTVEPEETDPAKLADAIKATHY